MLGPILALLCFAMLLAWGAYERRRTRQREFERQVQLLQDEVEAMFARMGEALVPAVTAAMEALVPVVEAAAAVFRAFGEALGHDA